MVWKIFFEDFYALFPQDARSNPRPPKRIFKYRLAAAVSFVSENVFQIRVARAVYQTPQLYPDERAAAHETRLTAGIQRIFFEVRDPRPRAEIPNQSRFGVISGIVLRVNPIFALENDLSAFDEHRAERFVSAAHRHKRTVRTLMVN